MIGAAKPYFVGLWFQGPLQGEHQIAAIVAVNEADATARAVSQYYVRGGRLPFVASSVMLLTEETCRNALALIEADRAADQAEAEKVVGLQVVQQPEGET